MTSMLFLYFILNFMLSDCPAKCHQPCNINRRSSFEVTRRTSIEKSLANGANEKDEESKV